jgi:hypothetical protein
MDYPKALSDRVNELRFLLGMPPSTFIIVSKDNDVSTDEAGFAAGGQTVASTAERDSEGP